MSTKLKHVRRTTLSLATFGILSLSFGLPQTGQRNSPPSNESNGRQAVKSFVKTYAYQPSGPDLSTVYFPVLWDLNADGRDEAIVYLTGPRWCGSGGCTVLIVELETSMARLVTKTTISRPPIRVLNTASNGWRDVAVWVQGGGIPGYEAVLRFDGKSYPNNPTIPPARRASANVAGSTVISADLSQQASEDLR